MKKLETTYIVEDGALQIKDKATGALIWGGPSEGFKTEIRKHAKAAGVEIPRGADLISILVKSLESAHNFYRVKGKTPETLELAKKAMSVVLENLRNGDLK